MARGKAAEKGAILERQLQALDMRKRGLSYREIGKKLGVDYTTAYKDVMKELKRLASLRDDKLEELRELELERLDMLITALEPMARAGDPSAVNAFLKCMERRAKYLGLDATQNVKVTIDDLRQQAINDIRAGVLTYEALAAEDVSLATELFAAAGVPIEAG